MYVAISTDKQNGSILGHVREQRQTLAGAWRAARKLNSPHGRGVVREVVAGEVAIGEAVGFFDERLKDEC